MVDNNKQYEKKEKQSNRNNYSTDKKLSKLDSNLDTRLAHNPKYTRDSILRFQYF